MVVVLGVRWERDTHGYTYTDAHTTTTKPAQPTFPFFPPFSAPAPPAAGGSARRKETGWARWKVPRASGVARRRGLGAVVSGGCVRFCVYGLVRWMGRSDGGIYIHVSRYAPAIRSASATKASLLRGPCRLLLCGVRLGLYHV